VGTERDDAICVNIFTPRWLLCEMAERGNDKNVLDLDADFITLPFRNLSHILHPFFISQVLLAVCKLFVLSSLP